MISFDIGIVQGTVQGPLLFLSAIQHIDCNYENVNYADDKTIIFDNYSSQIDIDNCINELKISYKACNLDLNKEKTKALSINYNLNKHNNNNNKNTEYNTNSLKILGINIQNKFSISEHIIGKVKKGSASLFALLRLKKDLHLDIKETSLLFNTTINSNILYGIEFIYPLMKVSDKNLLLKFYKNAVKFGILNSTYNIENVIEKRSNKLYEKLSRSKDFEKWKPKTSVRSNRTILPSIQRSYEEKTFFNHHILKDYFMN
jgi:hypothetical protein